MIQYDTYGRKINYLRISITDRCNLRCVYCMPPEGIPLISHSDILRYEEIIRIARLAYDTGFRKFRITGGEPLARKGISQLIGSISRFGNNLDLSLTTNGVFLAKNAEELKASGLPRINISLDTMDREKFMKMSRFDALQDVIDGIEAAVAVGFDPVKINVVTVHGVNDNEIMDFVELTKDKPLWVRFIELMPFSRNEWSSDKFISSDDVRQIIESGYQLSLDENDINSPATYYNIKGHKGKIGFISPISSKFCHLCNRLRLTADGYLLPCLHSDIEYDIKSPMREGASDDELRDIFLNAIYNKPGGHELCGSVTDGCSSGSTELRKRIMSRIGG